MEKSRRIPRCERNAILWMICEKRKFLEDVWNGVMWCGEATTAWTCSVTVRHPGVRSQRFLHNPVFYFPPAPLPCVAPVDHRDCSHALVQSRKRHRLTVFTATVQSKEASSAEFLLCESTCSGHRFSKATSDKSIPNPASLLST